MLPFEIPLGPIQKGDTTSFNFEFNFVGEPLDMRGKTLEMTFKFDAAQADSKAPLTKTTVVAEDDADAELGQVVVTLESSETQKLYAGVTYSVAIKLIEEREPEDKETTLMYSYIAVEDH